MKNRIKNIAETLKKPYSRQGFFTRTFKVAHLAVCQFIGGEYPRQATALTYYTLFAIVPMAALFFGIAKGFSLEVKLKEFLYSKFSEQEEILNWIYRFAETTLNEASGGWIAGIGVIFLLATVIMLASNIEDTFNMIWYLPQKRNIIQKVRNYLAILVVTPFMLIIAGGAPVIEKTLHNALESHGSFAVSGLHTLLNYATELIPFAAIWLIFSLIYCFVPNTRVRFKSAVIAAFLAGAAFYILQSSLMFLQVMLAKYNTIYGSFAIVPLFLIWMQWSWLIILFGAETAFVHQNANSGRFDREGRECSRRVRKIYLLAITRYICRSYEQCKGAAAEEELIRELRLTRYAAGDFLEELCRSGIIVQLESMPEEGRRFVPAIPCARLTPVKVMEMLDIAGDNNPDPENECVLANIDAVCRRLEDAAAESPANRPLKDM